MNAKQAIEQLVGQDGKPIPQTTDAVVWAKEFCSCIKKNPSIPSDEGTMIGWFANAIMAGVDSKQCESLIEAYWHGTASGDLRGGATGLHVGTHLAAYEALTATIGYPVSGVWDGTREYGKTLLCGKRTLQKRGIRPTGFNCGFGSPFPEDDFYPGEYKPATFSNGQPIPLDSKPDIFELEIVGKMSNSEYRPHGDSHANGRMRGLLKRGKAKSGYFYKNDGEDWGSISAVLPGEAHIRKIEREAGI